MNTKLLTPALLFALAALAPSIASAQTALINYTFDSNTPGTITGAGTVINAVTPGTDNGVISTNGGTQYGQISSNGVSGATGDYAYNDTTTNNTGGNYAGSGILVGGSPSVVSLSLTSFTIALWYNGSQTVTQGTRLLSIGGTNGIGDLVFLNSANSTTAQANQLEFTGATGTLATATIANNQWNFIAVTYSLSGTTATYSIYTGTTATTATLLSTSTATVSGNMSITALSFGSNTSNARSFPGLLDDISVYGSTSGSSSAMNLGQIQSLQASAIPEPSTYALLVGFLSFGLVVGGRYIRRSQPAASTDSR